MRHVAAVPAAALLAGSACGLLFPDPPFVSASLVLVLALAGALIASVGRRPRSVATAIVVGFFSGGALLSSVAWQRAWRPPLMAIFEDLAHDERIAATADGRRLADDDEAFAVIEGVLRADASPSDAGASLSVAVDRMAGSEPPISGGVAVTVVGALAGERMVEWRAGRRVRLPVLLHRPSRYLDPGVPDHERELARRGTRLVGTVKSGALVEVLARGGWWSERLADARAFARKAIADHVGRWSAQSAAIVAAIVVGDRSSLDADVQRALQEAGTYHVIAISGGNIAILAGLLVGAFRVAGWLGRSAMIAAIALLLAYAQLVGGGASVDRATLMAVVYFGARALDQRSPPLNALAVVAALVVASNPLSIVDSAFLLTFGATLAILIVVPVFRTSPAVILNSGRRAADGPPRVARLCSVGGAIISGAWTMLVASVAAEILLFPITARLFSRVTLAGLGLNFLAIPLMGVAQVAGMLAIPSAVVSAPLASVAGWVAHAGALGLVWSAHLVRFAPALAWRVAPPPLVLCAAYYLALGIAWTMWRRRDVVTGSDETAIARRARISSALVAAVVALWIAVDPRTLVAARGDGRLHVTVLDVGQGDSIFVVFPHGSTLLVDAGGLGFSSSFDIGDRVVAAVVRDAGFRRIDRLALTHGDPDHIGGAASVVRELRPREVWEGIPVPRSEPLTRLRLDAQSAGACWSNVYAGDRIAIDDVDVVAWNPNRPDWERQKVRNDDSLVLELRWRDVSIVLTGDIGRSPEQAIARGLAPSRLRVLKIPHHGSLTSSSPPFIAALQPTVAIVSAGRGNHFGHPVPEVLERYRAAGAAVFRTDRDGAVTIDSDGYSLHVGTWNGSRPRLSVR